jgi:mannose-1-phosphate guanylyltransferase
MHVLPASAMMRNMIVVIIAGGAGTRLWPLSTAKHPKHLLCIKGDKSFLQTSYERGKMLTDKICVVTVAEHLPQIKEQLPDLTDEAFIVEPARRNTAGCFLAALRYIRSRYDPDDPIAILWADHYVRDVEGFARSFKIAAEASKKYQRPVLIGIEPTHPTPVLGYIHKAKLLEGEQLVHEVESFKEKPAYELAKQFVNSGEYLWNPGYMVSPLAVLERTMQTYTPEFWQEYQTLLAAKSDRAFEQAYLARENAQLELVFNELVKNFLVVPGVFDWMDLGSYGDLHVASDSDERGNSLHGTKVVIDETNNSYIRNEEAKPLVVIGMDNVAVVNTPEGILVVRKDLAPRVRDVIKAFEE